MNCMGRLCILANRDRGANRRASLSLMRESWEQFRNSAGDLESRDEPAIYEKDFWTVTRDVQTDIEIGRGCAAEGPLKEEEFLLKFKEKFKLNDNFRAIFTDGFKQVGNRSTGIGMVIHGENILAGRNT